MTAFTPGPWQLDLWPKLRMEHEPVMSACIVEQSGGVVAGLNGWDEMNEADARLMAAAPDLYRVLSGVYRALIGTSVISGRAEMIADIALVLMKARGEA
jgi:hypothetical protein